MKFNLGDLVYVKNSFDPEIYHEPIYGRITTIHISTKETWLQIDKRRGTFDENELALLDENKIIDYLEEERKKRYEFIDQAIDAEIKNIRTYISKGGKLKNDIDDSHL